MCLKRMDRNSLVFLLPRVNFRACEELQCYLCSRCILSITRDIILQGIISQIPVEREVQVWQWIPSQMQGFCNSSNTQQDQLNHWSVLYKLHTFQSFSCILWVQSFIYTYCPIELLTSVIHKALSLFEHNYFFIACCTYRASPIIRT